MYDCLCSNNRKNMDNCAIEYYGNTFSFRELINEIDCIANALKEKGISKGDVITIQAISVPQIIALIYAISKIGAIANIVYATLKEEDLETNIEFTSSKMYFSLDFLYAKNQFSADKCKHLQKIVIISTGISISFNDTVISWEAFMQDGMDCSATSLGMSDDPVVMLYTGGTTGKSKAVILTNYMVNVGSLQYMCLEFERGHSLLSMLPPFIAFGVTVSIHMPLLLGLKMILCNSVNPIDIVTCMLKYRTNYVICGTAQAEKIVDLLNKGTDNLDFLTFFAVGGDALTKFQEDKINVFLKNHNTNVRIVQGYGLSETSASTSAAVPKLFKSGTVGIPFMYTNVKIVEPGSDMELPFNKSGEVCLQSPCIMKGYFKNEEETSNVLKTHKDGETWLHTGDVGFVDEDGFITIIGRIKRMILVSTEVQFFKVFPKLVEDQLLKSGLIQGVSIVGKPDVEKNNILVAFVVSNIMSDNKLIEALRKYADENLEIYERPGEYVVIENLPLTTVGKVDYRKLELMVKKEIS